MKPNVNERAFYEVMDRIAEEPRNFEMNWWVADKERIARHYGPHSTRFRDHEGGCGTTVCMAGHAVAAAVMREKGCGFLDACLSMLPFEYTVQSRATAILGITPEQAEALFYIQHWPEKFYGAYHCHENNSPQGRANVAIERMKHFLKTGE